MNLDQRTVAFCRAVTLELARLRKESGLSQNQLAPPSGLDQSAITLLESGRRSPSVASLYRLAEALGTTPAKVLQAAQESIKAQSKKEPVSLKKAKRATPVNAPGVGQPRSVKRARSGT